MKFIHISDTHFGAFSSYVSVHLKVLESFLNVLKEDVDFILIAGDIFNTPVQMFDGLDDLISSMKSFIENGKRIYAVPGSHDISSGISLFDILESAGIITNVARYDERDGYLYLLPTYDERSGITLYGLGGETNSREVDYFKKIRVDPEENSIFVFHSPIKGSIGIYGAREIEISDIPSGFSYYAGGHVHKRVVKKINNSYLVYPGTFFASSFDELYNNVEKGYALVEDFKPIFIDINPVKILRKDIDCNGMLPEAILDNILRLLGENQQDITFLNLRGRVNFDPDEINIGKIPMKFKKKSIIVLRKKELLGIEEKIHVANSPENEINNIKNPFSFDTFNFSEKLKLDREEGERMDDFKKRLITLLEDELKKVENHDNQSN